MLRRSILRTAALAAAAVVASAGWSAPASADEGELRIGLNNWAENVAVSNMWKILLEEKGYDVELISAGKSVIYDGVARKNLDIGLEVWMPTTDKPFYSKYEDRIALQDAWYRGTGLGLVVPAYVDEVDTIPELKANAEMFDEKIVGIDPGSALMGLTEDAIDAYGLEDFELVASSGPGMTSALKKAIRQDEPVVVTLWNPHWAFADFDLKYLKDPKNVYGQGENIHWMSHMDLKDENPKVVEWLNAWDMNDQQLGGLMAVINEVGDPAKGASQWIGNNRELVDSWMQ
ncbi:glycine betaine ABC transporter substrate-binding protein [Ferruginivarius sediminum]|uniref:Glycine/betaine ABC transporter substrate-binding protein n=1 Tax=Ferruginivarius sediminum TaxID=2661937 RepID=A0A369T5G3_9PROT|nr:glycine betaine ABC transporter substrate-binding protein [Ferruginivarius sediminum]RDD60559.1 glycine/betaine ABC transporter substrate-binding protein [Ferruginivarius sediminum]